MPLRGQDGTAGGVAKCADDATSSLARKQSCSPRPRFRTVSANRLSRLGRPPWTAPASSPGSGPIARPPRETLGSQRWAVNFNTGAVHAYAPWPLPPAFTRTVPVTVRCLATNSMETASNGLGPEE
jgi:hypothetical protein